MPSNASLYAAWFAELTQLHTATARDGLLTWRDVAGPEAGPEKAEVKRTTRFTDLASIADIAGPHSPKAKSIFWPTTPDRYQVELVDAAELDSPYPVVKAVVEPKIQVVEPLCTEDDAIVFFKSKKVRKAGMAKPTAV